MMMIAVQKIFVIKIYVILNMIHKTTTVCRGCVEDDTFDNQSIHIAKTKKRKKSKSIS